MDKLYSNTLGNQDQEIVLFKDERSPVTNARMKPFRWICSLEVTFPEPVIYPLGTLEHPGKSWRTLKPSRKGCGSGLLIAPGHVLTAAHVIAGLKVVKEEHGKPAKFKLIKASSVRVIPARDDQQKTANPFGVFESQSIEICPEFQSAMEKPVEALTKSQIRKALSFDYGVIKIKEKKGTIKYPGQSAGWWREDPIFKIQPVEGLFNNKLVKNKIRIAGYPGDKGKRSCSTPWTSIDRVVAVKNDKKERLLMYVADTVAGMSGSPVWMKDPQGTYLLVAVHSSFLDVQLKNNPTIKKVNIGCLITPDTMEQFKKWKVNYLSIAISTNRKNKLK